MLPSSDDEIETKVTRRTIIVIQGAHTDKRIHTHTKNACTKKGTRTRMIRRGTERPPPSGFVSYISVNHYLWLGWKKRGKQGGLWPISIYHDTPASSRSAAGLARQRRGRSGSVFSLIAPPPWRWMAGLKARNVLLIAQCAVKAKK